MHNVILVRRIRHSHAEHEKILTLFAHPASDFRCTLISAPIELLSFSCKSCEEAACHFIFVPFVVTILATEYRTSFLTPVGLCAEVVAPPMRVVDTTSAPAACKMCETGTVKVTTTFTRWVKRSLGRVSVVSLWLLNYLYDCHSTTPHVSHRRPVLPIWVKPASCALPSPTLHRPLLCYCC